MAAQSLVSDLLDEETANVDDIEQWMTQYVTIDINLLDSQQLVLTGRFSPYQAGSLVDYRNRYGYFVSPYELQVVPGFDPAELSLTMPFLVAGGSPDTKKIPGLTYALFRLERTLENSQAYRNNIYYGSPWKRQLRIRSGQSKKYSWGFMAENDAGEPWRSTGFDHYSFHYLKYGETVKQWVVGDFSYQSGEGLVFGSGLGLGKSLTSVTSVKVADLGLRPHTSSVESGFYRGGAFTLAIAPKWELTHLISFISRDATLYGTGAEIYFNTFRRSGYHRSEREILFRGSVNELTLGGNLRYKGRSFNWGVNGIFHAYDYGWRNSGQRRLHTTSMFYDLRKNNIFLFGEWALDHFAHLAGIQGALLSLSSSTSAGAVLRYYMPGFHSPYGSYFGEFASGENEKGIYLTLTHQVNRGLEIATFFDQFSRPLPSGREPPIKGYEWGTLLQVKLPGKGTLILRIGREQRDGAREGKVSAEIGETTRTQGRMVVGLPFGSGSEWRFRFQNSMFDGSGGTFSGSLMAMEMINKFRSFNFSNRICYFDTDDHEVRQYIYERDLEYSLSLPSFQDTGVRWYSMVRWKPGRRLTLWLRFSRTVYRKINSTGSGDDLTEGNKRSDLKFQVRYHLNSKSYR